MPTPKRPSWIGSGAKVPIQAANPRSQAVEMPAWQRMSIASAKSMQQLLATETTLCELEQKVASVQLALRAVQVPRSSAKSQLAQIEAQAKQLEAAGVDAVITTDLQSGRQAAKDVKKELLQRLELLFTRLDGLFQQLG
ncbi:unnamed protein product [Symbiodinium pilosum]|uniref:Uncharacterized protein n=1 Tax=Symbiodinium pilosum TaxID=2952 RepID=A0A812VYV0_SYMPI|nr:unnamed protein product [Symbiodinium pilosum]